MSVTIETVAQGRRRPAASLAIICAAIVLVPITATGASIALPDISTNLNTSLTSAQWAVNAFFLTFASFMAISGSLADLTGRRRMFAGGVGLFCAAMIVATFAPNIDVLIAARAIAGIGAAATTTGGSAVLAQTFKGTARTKAFGVFGTSIGLGLAFGPLAAGALVTSLGGWRAFFLAAAIVLLPVLVLSPLLTESRDAHPAGPDWVGAITFTGGLVLFVLGMVEGPSLGWTDPLVFAAFVLFVVLMTIFVVFERRVAHPMIDVSLFVKPRFMAIAAMPFLLAFGFVALVVELPVYFVTVNGITPQSAGLLLMLLTGPTLVMPIVVSSFAHRMPQQLLLVLTMVLVAAGAAWLTVVHPHASAGLMAGPLLTIGIGFGASLAILDGAAVSSVEPAKAGMAAGVFNTMRLTGEVVAISMLGALLTAVTQDRVAGVVGSDSAARVTSGLLEGDMNAAVGASPVSADTTRAAGADAFTDALHGGLWAIAALSLIGAIVVGLLARGGTTVPQAEPAVPDEMTEYESASQGLEPDDQEGAVARTLVHAAR